jgi:IS66 Orf2 like protein
MLWWDGDGLCLFAKRLERGRFLWPQSTSSRRLVPYTLRTGPGYVASLRSLVTSVIPSTIA